MRLLDSSNERYRKFEAIFACALNSCTAKVQLGMESYWD